MPNLTEGGIRDAVLLYDSALAFVPEAYRSRELDRYAIKMRPHAVAFVKRESVSDALLTVIVKAQADVIGRVPENWLTEALCLAAVKKRYAALEFVPESHRTKAVCQAALARSGSAFQYVPEALRDFDTCVRAVRRSPTMAAFLPRQIVNDTAFWAALRGFEQQRALAAAFAQPPRALTTSFYETAMRYRGSDLLLSDVPRKHRTLSVCVEGFYEHPYDRGGRLVPPFDWGWVPEESWTEALCMKALKSDLPCWPYIPERCKTPKVLIAAMAAGVSARDRKETAHV